MRCRHRDSTLRTSVQSATILPSFQVKLMSSMELQPRQQPFLALQELLRLWSIRHRQDLEVLLMVELPWARLKWSTLWLVAQPSSKQWIVQVQLSRLMRYQIWLDGTRKARMKASKVTSKSSSVAVDSATKRLALMYPKCRKPVMEQSWFG